LLILASFLLTFGLLLTAVLAAAIKISCLPKRARAYELVVRGGALGVLIALVAFAALGQAGIDLDSCFLGDLLQNGVALVSIGALTGTILAALCTRVSPAAR